MNVNFGMDVDEVIDVSEDMGLWERMFVQRIDLVFLVNMRVGAEGRIMVEEIDQEVRS